MRKRLMALLLSLCLVVACLPMTAAAEETAQRTEMAYPVHVLQKTGSDRNNLVLLIFGEGFTQNQQTQFLEEGTLAFSGDAANGALQPICPSYQCLCHPHGIQ